MSGATNCGILGAVCAVALLGACPDIPPEDTFTIVGDLERDGVGGGSATAFPSTSAPRTRAVSGGRATCA